MTKADDAPGMNALAFATFKRRYGVTQAQINNLAKAKRVEIQQNGYVGDSMHHHKLVVFKDKDAVFQSVLPKVRDQFEQSTKEPPKTMFCRRCRIHVSSLGTHCPICNWDSNPKTWSSRYSRAKQFTNQVETWKRKRRENRSDRRRQA